MTADILTKALPPEKHERFVKAMGMRPGSCYGRWNTRSGGVLEIRSYLVCRMTNTYIPATSTACIYWLADITVCAALRSTSENFVPCYSFGLPFSSGSFVKVQA